MPVVVVVGAQWGDEAKGKIVDLFAQRADTVVRYGGGSNAGHTVAAGDQVLKLHLMPSGILNARARCVISDGVVIDPAILIDEIDSLHAAGICTDNFSLSPYAHVVLPHHRELDRLEEESKGEGRLGTTIQGIGPAYADKARRCGLRVEDLIDRERLEERLPRIVQSASALLTRVYGAAPVHYEQTLERCICHGDRLRRYVRDTGALVHGSVTAGERVVFEGAQGTLLDIDYGTYPFVTSSHPTAGGACLGTGIGPRAIDHVLGICKAYTTRVGAGSFATELLDETGDLIRNRGQEFGTTTGRPRRIGWLDTVVLRYSARVNGMDALAITLVDVLDTLPEIQICTGYRRQGELLTELPIDRTILEDVEPVYETSPGWLCPTDECRSYAELPENARRYVERVSELAGVPVALVSVGKRRDQTIWQNGAFPAWRE